MTEKSQAHSRPTRANEIAIVIVATLFWLFFAGIGVVAAGVIGLGIFVAGWAHEEPQFSAPIEWRSTAQSNDWRGEESLASVRLETDGSAWVESIPIAPQAEGWFAEWVGSCFNLRDASTYTGPASWSSGIGGSVELEFLGSRAGLSAIRQDWKAPRILGCDDVFDIDLEIVCGDPGNARPERWTPCEPQPK